MRVLMMMKINLNQQQLRVFNFFLLVLPVFITLLVGTILIGLKWIIGRRTHTFKLLYQKLDKTRVPVSGVVRSAVA